jgi:hypothetical protein
LDGGRAGAIGDRDHAVHLPPFCFDGGGQAGAQAQLEGVDGDVVEDGVRAGEVDVSEWARGKGNGKNEKSYFLQ